MKLRIAALAAVVVLSSAAGAVAATTFRDVPADDPHADAIAWAAEHGITVGCADGEFCPSDPTTRGQMVEFLYRLSGADPDVDPVVDADTVDGYDAAELLASGGSSGAALPTWSTDTVPSHVVTGTFDPIGLSVQLTVPASGIVEVAVDTDISTVTQPASVYVGVFVDGTQVGLTERLWNVEANSGFHVFGDLGLHQAASGVHTVEVRLFGTGNAVGAQLTDITMWAMPRP